MQYAVVGIFGSFGDAEAAVRDLELAGIAGEQVEVISDINEDARTANTSGEPSTKPREPHHSRIARLFGAGGPLGSAPTAVQLLQAALRAGDESAGRLHSRRVHHVDGDDDWARVQLAQPDAAIGPANQAEVADPAQSRVGQAPSA